MEWKTRGQKTRGQVPARYAAALMFLELHTGWRLNPVTGPELPLLVPSKKLQHYLSPLVFHWSLGENYCLSTCASHPSGLLCLPHLPFSTFSAHPTFLSVFFPVTLFPFPPPFPPPQCQACEQHALCHHPVSEHPGAMPAGAPDLWGVVEGGGRVIEHNPSPEAPAHAGHCICQLLGLEHH